MNKNRKLGQTAAVSLAVGMAMLTGTAQICTVPVYAQAGSAEERENTQAVSGGVFKDETVYVNTDASGNPVNVTVSNWLKNSGNTGSVKDKSLLEGIKNVKGDETFVSEGDSLIWNTDGKDIYYQGTTEKELPFSIKLTWYLDGKEITPEELNGKSGRVKIKIDYVNHSEKTVNTDGKPEKLYSPFVMMTGMLLPEENCSNVTIDNGKVISDGNRNMVIGFAMPGLKESLGITDSDSASFGLTVPESLTVCADVTDFTVPSTFTAVLTDLTEGIDLEGITDMDDLQEALDQMEDAALELSDGALELSDGTDALSGGIDAYTEGAEQLNTAVQQYLGEGGELNKKVTEYVNGVNTVVQGAEDYTAGGSAVAEGISSYIKGEEELAEGAAQLEKLGDGFVQIQKAVNKIAAAADGRTDDGSGEDIQTAAEEIAEGTTRMEQALGSDAVGEMFDRLESMTQTGRELTEEAGNLGAEIQQGIAVPAENITKALESISGELKKLEDVQNRLSAACDNANFVIAEDNAKIADTKNEAVGSAAQIQKSVDALTIQKENAAAVSPETAEEIQKAIDALNEAKNSVSGLNSLETLDSIQKDQLGFSEIDMDVLEGTAEVIQENMNVFLSGTQELKSRIPVLEEKLDEIQQAGEELPGMGLEELSAQVKTLNEGMQQLNAAIGGQGGLSESLEELNGTVSVVFPKAVEGIDALNAGFGRLGQFHSPLLKGAEQLGAGGEALNAGVRSLAAGTGELASGLGTLGGQLAGGASALAGGSQTLRDGAAQLTHGAHTLADGMKQFEQDGTGKLKKTVEEELGAILKRLKALSSEEAEYGTFSGRDGAMDGSVKFIIETAAAEK